MEQADRDKIIQNIEKIIQYTDYDELMRQCIDRKLIFDVMREQIEVNLDPLWSRRCVGVIYVCDTMMRDAIFLFFSTPLQTSTPDRKMRHKYLLQKITRRGPKAFSAFSSILMNKFPDAYDYFNHLETVYDDISLARSRTSGRSHIVNNNNNTNTNCVNNSVENPRECSPPKTNTMNDVTLRPIEREQSPPTPLGAIGSTANGSTSNGSKTDDVVCLKEFTLPLKSRHNYAVQKSTKFHGLESGSKVSTYRMRSINRGVLFLVNIVHFDQQGKKRNGADADRDNLIALFREMGFKIFYHENLKRDVSSPIIPNTSK